MEEGYGGFFHFVKSSCIPLRLNLEIFLSMAFNYNQKIIINLESNSFEKHIS